MTFQVDGCLVDNYILCADGLKTCIIKEAYLNEWTSGVTVRMYNEMPKKYSKVIDFICDGETEKAEKVFFN